MRAAAAWVALVGLALVAVASGHVLVGLAIAAVKSAVVGAEYMELRHADRAHGIALAGAIAVLTIALAAIAG